jgi:hypothetical protein
MVLKRLWEFDKTKLEEEMEKYKNNYEKMMARFAIKVGRDLCCLQSYTNEENLGPATWLWKFDSICDMQEL